MFIEGLIVKVIHKTVVLEVAFQSGRASSEKTLPLVLWRPLNGDKLKGTYYLVVFLLAPLAATYKTKPVTLLLSASPNFESDDSCVL